MAGQVICPKCREAKEAKFMEVKQYVTDHRGADIMEVSEECDVEIPQIHQWIREERLQFADDSPIRIACESCGTMIRSGRFCDKCKVEMTNGLKSAMGMNKPSNPEPAPQKRKSDGSKMRFL